MSRIFTRTNVATETRCANRDDSQFGRERRRAHRSRTASRALRDDSPWHGLYDCPATWFGGGRQSFAADTQRRERGQPRANTNLSIDGKHSGKSQVGSGGRLEPRKRTRSIYAPNHGVPGI